jgi:hypothetical protein
MAQFKPGRDPRRNTKGRPKGSGDLSVEGIRSLMREFLADNLPGLQEVYDKLIANQKWTLLERIAKHVVPPPLDPVERLSEDQFERLKEEIIESMKKQNHGTEQKTTPSTANGSNAGE